MVRVDALKRWLEDLEDDEMVGVDDNALQILHSPASRFTVGPLTQSHDFPKSFNRWCRVNKATANEVLICLTAVCVATQDTAINLQHRAYGVVRALSVEQQLLVADRTLSELRKKKD